MVWPGDVKFALTVCGDIFASRHTKKLGFIWPVDMRSHEHYDIWRLRHMELRFDDERQRTRAFGVHWSFLATSSITNTIAYIALLRSQRTCIYASPSCLIRSTAVTLSYRGRKALWNYFNALISLPVFGSLMLSDYTAKPLR